MTTETLALIVSFIAMSLVVSSYFFKKKSLYLLFQGVGIVFLILSYLLTGEYFAMIGLGVGLIRTVVFFLFEEKNKRAPLSLSLLFAAMTAAAYFIVNFGVLQTAKPLDILYLAGLVLYAFTFRIRDLKTMRFVTLIPAVLSVLYNALLPATPFVIVSYSFELAAVVFSILKYHVFGKKQGNANRFKGVNTYEIR